MYHEMYHLIPSDAFLGGFEASNLHNYARICNVIFVRVLYSGVVLLSPNYGRLEGEGGRPKKRCHLRSQLHSDLNCGLPGSLLTTQLQLLSKSAKI